MILWQDAVYDRTQADVDKLKSYIATRWENLSEAQKAEFLNGMKGAINAADIDRIQNNINLLCEVLEIDKRLKVGRNLIPFPYLYESRTINGVAWTVNDDGSVTANGTATADSNFAFVNRTGLAPFLYLQKGNSYALSGISGGSKESYYIQLAANVQETGKFYGITDLYSGYKITSNIPYENTRVSVLAIIASGYTANNVTFRPMLELGNKAHEYEIWQPDRTANIPYVTTIADMLDIVQTIRESYSIHADTPKTPSQPVNTFGKWNDVEKILADVHEILLNNFHYYAGTELYAGDSIGYVL